MFGRALRHPGHPVAIITFLSFTKDWSPSDIPARGDRHSRLRSRTHPAGFDIARPIRTANQGSPSSCRNVALSGSFFNPNSSRNAAGV